VASTIDSHDGSPGDPAFHIEQRGIDFVPVSERWATPRNIGALWPGRHQRGVLHLWRVAHGFGFSFYTALSIIIIGNLSFCCWAWRLSRARDRHHGVHYLAGTFGTQGSRLVSFFNWVTQLGF